MRRVDVERLLRVLGIAATREGIRFRASCPNPEHPHPPGKVSTPSWSIRDDEEAGSHHCFGCSFGGGPWELVAAVRGLTLAEAGEWLRLELGGSRGADMADVPLVRVVSPRPPPSEMTLPFGVQIPSVDGSTWFGPAHEYLVKPISQGGRGLAPWQLERWHLGYALRGRCAMRVVVPIYTRGRLLSYVARAIVNDGRNRYDVASKKTDPGARPEVALFGEPGFDEPDEEGKLGVGVVAEGLFGMMAFERAGAPSPSAILGASNLGPEKVELLSRFKLLLVGTDPDLAGDKAFQIIYEALCRWTEVRRIPLIHKPDESSDEGLEAAWRGALK